MQKLVKRKMHYETIMPVEAYEGEEEKDEDWGDIISVALSTLGMGIAACTGSFVGVVLAGLSVGNTAWRDEENMAFTGEAAVVQAESQVAMGEAINNTIQSTGDAIMEGFIDWSSDIDYDDPIVQAYGE